MVVHESNYFKDHDPVLVRKKYMQYRVFIEALNESLELKEDEKLTLDMLAKRISDLVTAASKL